MLRRANMARYRSNSGNPVSNNEDFKDNIFGSDTSSGLGWPERSREVGGAGSIEVYILKTSRSAAHIGQIYRILTESSQYLLRRKTGLFPLQNCPTLSWQLRSRKSLGLSAQNRRDILSEKGLMTKMRWRPSPLQPISHEIISQRIAI
jgi:hypothetical protein